MDERSDDFPLGAMISDFANGDNVMSFGGIGCEHDQSDNKLCSCTRIKCNMVLGFVSPFSIQTILDCYVLVYVSISALSSYIISSQC